MRSSPGIILIFTVLQLVIGGVGNAASASTGALRGQVLDLDTGRPVPSANVSVEGFNIGAATDMDGHFIYSQFLSEPTTSELAVWDIAL